MVLVVVTDDLTSLAICRTIGFSISGACIVICIYTFVEEEISYLIQKSFPPLLKRIHKLIRKSILGDFWRSVWGKYGHDVLDQAQVEWIIKAKGRCMKNADIARIQEISTRRVRQLYSQARALKLVSQGQM